MGVNYNEYIRLIILLINLELYDKNWVDSQRDFIDSNILKYLDIIIKVLKLAEQ